MLVEFENGRYKEDSIARLVKHDGKQIKYKVIKGELVEQA